MQFFKTWLTSLDVTNTSNCTIKVKNVLEYWQSVIKVHSWHDYTNDFYDLSSSILHLNNNLKLQRKLITSHFSNNLTSCISTGETSYYTLASSTITSNKKIFRIENQKKWKTITTLSWKKHLICLTLMEMVRYVYPFTYC